MCVERCASCGYEGGGLISLSREELGLYDDPGPLDILVSGWFQLSALSEYTALRALLPELQNMPVGKIIERLRSNELRWHIDSLTRGRALTYQAAAREMKLRFVFTEP
jgi:hypothetical protein